MENGDSICSGYMGTFGMNVRLHNTDICNIHMDKRDSVCSGYMGTFGMNVHLHNADIGDVRPF